MESATNATSTSKEKVITNDSEVSKQEKSLVKIPGNQSRYYDISAFLTETDHLMKINEHHFSMLVGVVKKCQRIVALANLENVPLEKSEINYLLYQLFELEEKLEKVEIIDFEESK